MRDAQQKLEQAQRDKALEQQEQAIRELEQAKAELEELLRQLREEELERVLAMLEGRFRKMLQQQVEVYESTLLLDRVPAGQRGRNDEIEAGRLSRKESQIVTEADKALAVLREDGTAAVFPEALSQVREDMLRIATLLGQAKVSEETQLIEEDVVAALEEMIEALKKAQQDLKQRRQPPSDQQQQQQGEPTQSLIDVLAELKLIRSLQLRINNRTEFYKKRFLADGQEQTELPQVLDALRELADRQQRVQQSAKDLALERNK